MNRNMKYFLLGIYTFAKASFPHEANCPTLENKTQENTKTDSTDYNTINVKNYDTLYTSWKEKQ